MWLHTIHCISVYDMFTIIWYMSNVFDSCECCVPSLTYSELGKINYLQHMWLSSRDAPDFGYSRSDIWQIWLQRNFWLDLADFSTVAVHIHLQVMTPALWCWVWYREPFICKCSNFLLYLAQPSWIWACKYYQICLWSDFKKWNPVLHYRLICFDSFQFSVCCVQM